MWRADAGGAQQCATDIGEAGVAFEITDAVPGDETWTKGDLAFVAWHNLTFRLKK